MAQVFDNGLSETQRAAIRNAIVALLAPLRRTSVPSLYLRAIATIPRLLLVDREDQAGRDMLANALLGQAPAVAIALGGMKYQPGGSDLTECLGDLEVGIYVASEHQRDVVEGRLYGDAISTASLTADPGIFAMLEHVRERLLGIELGLAGVAELWPKSENEVITADNVTVWEQRYQVTVNAAVNPARGITQLLTSIEDDVELDSVPAPPPFLTTVNEVEP